MTITELALPPIHGPQPQRCRTILRQAADLTPQTLRDVFLTTRAAYHAVGPWDTEAARIALGAAFEGGDWSDDWTQYRKAVQDAAYHAVWDAASTWAELETDPELRQTVQAVAQWAGDAAAAELVDHLVPDAARVFTAGWRAVFPED